jgi:1,4-alpha-glucan branching enzyme
MRRVFCGFLVWVSLTAVFVFAAQELKVSVRPELPTFEDRITIEVVGITNALWLHWGVNAKGNQWQKPLPAYIPKGSRLSGVAARTPFSSPDSNGIQRAQIGPFTRTNQEISTVDFVLLDDAGNWYNNDDKDFHIPISRGRISFTPEQPTLNDTITVRVHRSTSGGLLRWGVNALRGRWEPPADIYRPAGTIPSDDGLAVDTPLPPPDAAGISTIKLGPFNSGIQAVTSLHAAVHWDTVWDTDFGRNYNLAIALEDPALDDAPDFMEPQHDSRETGPFTALLSADAPVTLFLDGTHLTTLTNEPYASWILTDQLEYGPHRLTAQAGDPPHRALAVRDFWLVPEYKTIFRPLDAPFGATENDDGTITFALYAPGKHFVTLIGSFNDWDPLADPMNYSTNGVWWLTRELPPGSYEYQYMIDGQKALADPWGTDVVWQDEAGEEHWKPEFARSIIHVGAEPFAWEDHAYQRPALNELVIYELYISDLCPGEGFTGVIQRLDDIKDLGVNAIEPLPWNEFTGSESWGYNPSYHFATETTFGTPEQLKQLVNEAHKRGIAVIMDAVLNHMDAASALYQLYGDDYDASPYFYLFTGENWGFPDLDQESPAFKRYAADVLAFWINEFHIDGFRYDATRWVGWEGYNDWGASWFAYAAKQADPQNIQIAEHLPTDPDLFNQTEMDTGWHAHFRWRIKDALVDAQVHSNEFTRIMIPERLGFSNAWQRITYTESHDEQRMMHELEQSGYQPDEAVNRCISALVLPLTVPGVPMIYAGQEFGEYTPKVVGHNPLNTQLLEFPLNRRILNATRILCRLRTSLPALIGDQIELLQVNETDDTIVYRRGSGEDAILVGVNFSRHRRLLDFPLSPGTWTMPLKQKNINLRHAATVSYPLKPGESMLLVRENTP